jgi:hypothetical protein
MFNTAIEPLRLIALRLLYLKYKQVFGPLRELISKIIAVPFDKLGNYRSFFVKTVNEYCRLMVNSHKFASNSHRDLRLDDQAVSGVEDLAKMSLLDSVEYERLTRESSLHERTNPSTNVIRAR